MKKLIITAFAACSLMSGFGAVFTSAPAFAQTPCGPNAPEAWTRPGGFCDGSNGTRSLTTPVEGGYGTPCIVTGELVGLRHGERVHVAQANPCDETPSCEVCPTTFLIDEMPVGDRLRVAGTCCSPTE